MDDLISRKAVLDTFNRKTDMWSEETSKEFWLFCRVADVLDTIPSVPAVPLDKLCEWLAENALCIMRKNITPLKTDAGRWKDALTKWMEGLGGTD